MLKELKILFRHGKQYITDLEGVELTPLFRGRPEIATTITASEAKELEALCPTNAISVVPFSINLGKCVFCKECHFYTPEKIRFTNDHKIATNDLNRLIVKAGDRDAIELDASLVRKEITSYFGKALKLRQVSAAGDNSAEMELNAAGNVNFDVGRYGMEFVASPRHADGLVITGPISENMAEPLEICYNATPSPKILILAGTDAISGGIFADSKAVNRGFLSKYHVDLYVPGNPPHPLTFINGILSLTGRLKKK
ncbi:MAG: NADH:ubiquinone oxidoreductase [Prevotellaceae bacterium]|jgi:Ni,Fe-hydrogenase III small subunit|nr:NADH:ubiquinone oxidoreductase [Prevotellaceae bacterium]